MPILVFSPNGEFTKKATLQSAATVGACSYYTLNTARTLSSSKILTSGSLTIVADYEQVWLRTNATGTTTVTGLSTKEVANNSTTLAPQIGSTMHVGGLSDGATSATLVAHAGFDNLKVYSA